MNNKSRPAADGGYAAFVSAVSSIKPDRDIICGRRGSEENIKIKFLLPLLQYLGFDIARDADFELLQVDVVLRDADLRPVLAVETKAWEEELTRHLNQCLEYTFKLRCPFIIITSGRRTALYSSLGCLTGLSKTKPILEFSLAGLLAPGGEQLLAQLKLLAGKAALLSGAIALHAQVSAQLPAGVPLETARKEFLDKCSGFKPAIKTLKTSDTAFIKSAAAHGGETAEALLLAKAGLERLAAEYNLEPRYRSKEIGLQYRLSTGPRPRNIGLVGIYPERASIAFGIESWKELGCAPDFLARIQSFPRALKTRAAAEALAVLLAEGLKQAKSPREG